MTENADRQKEVAAAKLIFQTFRGFNDRDANRTRSGGEAVANNGENGEMDYYSLHGIQNFSEGFEANRFDRLPPEIHREISRRGGIASGKTRLRKALLYDYSMDWLERQVIAEKATAEFYAAVKQVMKKERQKRKRRKGKSKLDE